MGTGIGKGSNEVNGILITFPVSLIFSRSQFLENGRYRLKPPFLISITMNYVTLFLQISFIHISNSILLHSTSSQYSAYENFEHYSTTPAVVDYDDVNAKPRKSEILDKLLSRSTYDARIRPPALTGSGPTQVTVGIYLRSVENVDDVRMQYSVQITFWQEWNDPRLKYSHIQNNISSLQIIFTKRIWMPDLFFRNEKSGYHHELIVPNLYTRLYPDGRVLQSYRISLVLSCAMNLRAYPLDIQLCPISIGSYGWTTRDLLLKWRDTDPVRLASGFSTPRFNLKEYYTSPCKSVTPTGIYGCLDLQIKFAREFGFYLIQIYLPCSMLVIVSWVSFWLEPSAVEARVSLGVTTILTIVTQTYGINQSAPPASYAKALDVWTGWCQGMVFGALLEFATVNYLSHKQWIKAKKSLRKRKEESLVNKEEMENEEARLLSEAVARAKRIDRASRIIFPIIFAIFNVIYWYNYLVYHF